MLTHNILQLAGWPPLKVFDIKRAARKLDGVGKPPPSGSKISIRNAVTLVLRNYIIP